MDRIAARELDHKNRRATANHRNAVDEVDPPILDVQPFKVGRIGDFSNAKVEKKETNDEDHGVKIIAWIGQNPRTHDEEKYSP